MEEVSLHLGLYDQSLWTCLVLPLVLPLVFSYNDRNLKGEEIVESILAEPVLRVQPTSLDFMYCASIFLLNFPNK